MSIEPESSLILRGSQQEAALRSAISLWAATTTAADSARRADLLRDKQKAVTGFFTFIGKRPTEVTPPDVQAWREELERRQPALAPATVYYRLARLASFFTWALKHTALDQVLAANPVYPARPKAPRKYQTAAAQAWTDQEIQALIEVVRKKAATGDLVGKRDYALLLFYLLTGMRRQEVIALRGGDLKLGEFLIVSGQVKGGDYLSREVRDAELRAALEDYLSASGRWSVLGANGPLWTRHDRAGRPGAALTSHAFAKNLKRYAVAAGLGDVHLHQTRHSFARIVAEDTGSLTETQDALNHSSPATTRVYVQRITVKRDRHSERVAHRILKPTD